MMTPQEVSSHAFSKATLGGYNMAMVDEFLDLLTEDYTALYNDNAILKNKLKVLSDTVEEYRATDDAMRKTLLAAQKMADAMVKDAEAKKESLVHDAEAAAKQRVEELKAEIAAEEYRLQTAKEATAAFVAKVSKLYEAQALLLQELGKLAPAPKPEEEDRVEHAVQDIESNLTQIFSQEDSEAAHEDTKDLNPAAAPEAPDELQLDPDATRRFEDLKFGRDYEIR